MNIREKSTVRSLTIVGVWSSILILIPSCQSQTCRSLDNKIVYQYDPSHRIYSDAAVVLNVRNRNSDLAIFISISKETGGGRTTGILQSNDLGNHWIPFEKDDVPSPLALSGSPFVEAPSDPRTQYKYRESAGVFARSENGGKTWITPRNLIESLTPEEFARTSSGSPDYRTDFSFAAVYPSNPLALLVTLRLVPNGKSVGGDRLPRDLGLYRSQDGGEHWVRVTSSIQYGTSVGIDAANPSIMLGYGKANLVGVLKTADGGSTWSLAKQQKLMEDRPLLVAERNGSRVLGAPVGITVRQFAFDPASPKFAYIISTKGVYRSADSGDSWCLLDMGNDFLDSTYSLAFDPVDTSQIFVGTRFGVFYSRDRGDHFERIYRASR